MKRKLRDLATVIKLSRAYPAKAITLKTTKLGETDLILSMLSDEGFLLKGVLKSARNPRSKTVGHSALFQTNSLLLHKGKSLDIIVEVQSSTSRTKLISDYDKSVSAALMSEASFLSINAGNDEPQLFTMLESGLDSLESAPADKSKALALAFCLKLMALMGLRPQTEYCELCSSQETKMRWSGLRRAAVCEDCSSEGQGFESFSSESDLYSSETLSWINFLLKHSFAELATHDFDERALREISEIVSDLLEEVFSRKLNSYSLFTASFSSQP